MSSKVLKHPDGIRSKMSDNPRPWYKSGKFILSVYAILLLVSHLWEFARPVKYQPASRQKTLQVKEVEGHSVTGERSVTIAYLDEYNGTETEPPVVLLLHGSPIAIPMFDNLIPELSRQYRVIAPAMPGYEASSRNVPNYSIRSYSLYTKQLLDSLNVDSAHIVGYSLGGGVALNLAHFYPEKVESLDLLSSIGVQELELMGSYTLNHAIHGVQLTFIWLLHEAIPHFGSLARFPLNIPYARSFYESDQRPLRGYLKAYKKPMLIQQGIEDELVPFAAAEEHHRIVPQSKMIAYEGGHDVLLTHAKVIAKDLADFVDSVENGMALEARSAEKIRIQKAERPFKDIEFEKFKGITLVILMLIIIMGTLVSEDLTCIGAGLMAARGLIGFWPAVIACFIGIFMGDILLYLAGRWLGRAAVRKAPLKWFLSQKDLNKSEKWFRAKGPTIIIASRFLPGTRMPTYFSAGAVGAGFWMFTSYFLLACLLWTPLLVGLSMLIGTELIAYFKAYQAYALGIFLGIILFVLFMVQVVIPLFSYKGRRLLLSRWKRWTQWEFWPPYILYMPVCMYITFLWAKYKSLTIFTAANPCIEQGGFIGESKKDILQKFKQTGCVVSYEYLNTEEEVKARYKMACAFMKTHNLDFPVVLKPNEGQRGQGVKIIYSLKELMQALKAVNYDLIIQKYIPGREFGVFYYRYPGEERGHILSVTVKKFPTLTGDGKRTLEELILDDKRAVCLAKKHLGYHQARLYDIPARGETIPLVEHGTHARGAVFSDGSHLITPALIQAFDKICLSVNGFYFGRFDIRTPSEESLKKGNALHIIEVNGVTSEDTSIYDQKYSFWDAQKKLMKQWRIVFEIGAEEARKGASYSSIPVLVNEIAQYKAK